MYYNIISLCPSVTVHIVALNSLLCFFPPAFSNSLAETSTRFFIAISLFRLFLKSIHFSIPSRTIRLTTTLCIVTAAEAPTIAATNFKYHACVGMCLYVHMFVSIYTLYKYACLIVVPFK